MRDLMHNEGSIYVHCDWRVTAFSCTEEHQNRLTGDVELKRMTILW